MPPKVFPQFPLNIFTEILKGAYAFLKIIKRVYISIIHLLLLGVMDTPIPLLVRTQEVLSVSELKKYAVTVWVATAKWWTSVVPGLGFNQYASTRI